MESQGIACAARRLAPAILALMPACVLGAAKQPASPFSLELSAGLEYDTNVSIPEIDAATAKGDYAALLDADLGYRRALGTDSKLQLGYSLSQSLHEEFSEFDIQNHMVSGDLSHDFGRWDAGVTGRWFEVRLDNEAYLAMGQFSPWASRFFGKSLFVRADWTVTEKDFEDIPARDALQHAVGADAYWFVKGARRFFVAGYHYRDEDAEAAEFDYRSHNLKLRLTQRLTLCDRELKARIGWLYEDRDYRGVTPLIGEKRKDERSRLQADVEMPLGKDAFAVLEYEYGDYVSDLDSADYGQHVVSLKLGYRL